MGPYLAQPNIEKTRYKAENVKLKLRFGRCEMQGTTSIMKDGVEQWKMLQSLNWALEMETQFLVYLTAMEVHAGKI